MSSLPTIPSSATTGFKDLERSQLLQEAHRHPIQNAEAGRFARRYLEELSDSLTRTRPRSGSLQSYPSQLSQLRVIDRTQLAGSVAGRAWHAELRALRSGDVQDFHLDDVHVVLPIAGTIVTAGKDGRAIASAIDGESIVAQPIHPSRESPILFHGEVDEQHRPTVSESAWITAGASLGRHFALGRRDGTIFRGEIKDGENGERFIRRCWSYAAGSGKPANWAVMPEFPRIQQRQGLPVEDSNSRRVFGLALLPGSEEGPPALSAACGKALWNTSSNGGKPTVTPLGGLLAAADPQFPERILGLQGLPPSPGDTLSSLFVLGQERALWLTAEGSHNPLELSHRGTVDFDVRHVTAHWLPEEGGALGALGQARTGNLTVVQWNPDGSAQSEEWKGSADHEQAGTAWSIDHLSSDLLVSGHQHALVRLWDVRSGSPELDLSLPFGRASGIAADREQMQVIACLADDQCHSEGHGGASMAVWDLRKGIAPLAQSRSPLATPGSTEDLFELEA